MTYVTHLSARIPKELHEDIVNYQKKKRHKDKTTTVCNLIKLGLDAEEKIEKMDRLYQNVSLKSLFILRALTKTRGDEFLAAIDESYEMRKEEMEQMIMEFGVSYDD